MGHFFRKIAKYFASQHSILFRKFVRNDNTRVRWICSAKLCEKIPMSDLRTRMGISSIEDVMRYKRLRWFGHLQFMDEEK